MKDSDVLLHRTDQTLRQSRSVRRVYALQSGASERTFPGERSKTDQINNWPALQLVHCRVYTARVQYLADLINLLVYAVSRKCPENTLTFQCSRRIEIPLVWRRSVSREIDISLIRTSVTALFLIFTNGLVTVAVTFSTDTQRREFGSRRRVTSKLERHSLGLSVDR